MDVAPVEVAAFPRLLPAETSVTAVSDMVIVWNGIKERGAEVLQDSPVSSIDNTLPVVSRARPSRKERGSGDTRIVKLCRHPAT